MVTAQEMDAIVAGIQAGTSAPSTATEDSEYPESIQYETIEEWGAAHQLIWDGDNWIHFCGECDPTAIPPLVHCPVCDDIIEMSADRWYTCSCYPAQQTSQDAVDAYYEEYFSGIPWETSKKGNLYAKHNGMVMFIKLDSNGETYSTCAQLEDSDSKKPHIRWKNGHKDMDTAKKYIEERVNEAKAVKLF